MGHIWNATNSESPVSGLGEPNRSITDSISDSHEVGIFGSCLKISRVIRAASTGMKRWRTLLRAVRFQRTLTLKLSTLRPSYPFQICRPRRTTKTGILKHPSEHFSRAAVTISAEGARHTHTDPHRHRHRERERERDKGQPHDNVHPGIV